ncbi:19103_t:CDS:2, partial [Funneliformis geosporum]
MTRTLSIAIKEKTYQELRQKIGLGKISSFVNQAGYQDQTGNRKLKKMLQTYGKMSWEDISTELTA